MNILLTNDDGYDSYGIRLLQKKLEKYGTVVIVAPDSPMSAQSTSLTIGHPLHIKQVEKNVFSCDGSPADWVSMGLCVLNMEFDLVISGCNNGLNISYDTMYSGTIGAAQQALMFKKPAIAFSTPWDDYAVVEERFEEVFEYIQKHKLVSDQYLLNVNFPEKRFKGIKLGELYYRDDYQYMTEQEEGGFYAYRKMETDFSEHRDSDCYQVTHGIVSIVPLNKSYYDANIYKQLKKKIS